MAEDSTIKNKKSIHNEYRVVDKTSEVKSFQSISNFFNNDFTTFKTVKLFLPISISEDYRRILPENFLEDIFANCSDKFVTDKSLSDEQKVLKQEDYHSKIKLFRNKLINLLKPYTVLNKYDNTIDIGIRKESFNIVNCLAIKNNKDILTDKDIDRHFPASETIEYVSIPSIKEYINKHNLLKKAKSDIEDILFQLSELSELSAYLPQSINTYRQFAIKIITKMYGNCEQLYPRSIINYSAFQFCLKDYPFNTKSGRVYSVSNITSSVKNKFEIIDTFYKNIDAVLTFLSDIEFNEYTEYNSELIETETLINAYGICIALCALISEHYYYNKTIMPSLDSCLLDKTSSLGSIFFNKNTKKINEVHE